MAFEAVDELRAARLADIHQRHSLAVERWWRHETGTAHRRAFGGGVAQLRLRTHGRISLVTDWHSVRTRWPGQPPMMAENSPASPPARTISTPSGMGWNLSTTWSAYFGDSTSTALPASQSFGCPTPNRPMASERTSSSGVRDRWSMKPCTPSPWNRVTALLPGAMPRRTDSGSQSGSDSSSAKQKVYLPGLPRVARSMAPGRPPPTLRTMSCSARPIVALARLPWPSALTPEFMPIDLVIGPLRMTSGPEKCVVQSRPCRV